MELRVGTSLQRTYHKTVGGVRVKHVIVHRLVVQRFSQHDVAADGNRKDVRVVAQPVLEPLVLGLVGDDGEQDAVQRHVFQHPRLIVVLQELELPERGSRPTDGQRGQRVAIGVVELCGLKYVVTVMRAPKYRHYPHYPHPRVLH